MKKTLFVSAIIFLSLAPLACKRGLPVSPTVSPTPTPTPITTPVCGFISLSNINITPLPTLVPALTVTPVPTYTVYPSVTPNPTLSLTPVFYPFGPTPSVSYPNTPFGGGIIRTTADWQAEYGTTPIPTGLNLNTQMVLLQAFPGCCYGTAGFANVCETSTEVQVTLVYTPWTGPDQCYAICEQVQAIVVPKSNLPVVVTEVITN